MSQLIMSGSVGFKSYKSNKNVLKLLSFHLQINGVDVRSVPQDAAVQLVQRSVDKVTLLVEKDAEQLFKNSEFYSLVRAKFLNL